MSDLYNTLNADRSQLLGNRLEHEWNLELQKLKHVRYVVDDAGNKKAILLKPSFGKAIIRTFWADYVGTSLICAFQYIVLRTLQPILQSLVINYFSIGHRLSTQTEAMLHATALVLTAVVSTFIIHHTNFQTQRIGMQIRIACSALIYRKVCSLF